MVLQQRRPFIRLPGNMPPSWLEPSYQDLNAAMLPILLVFIILLVNNRRLMGRRVNNLTFNIISWVTVVLITIPIVLFLLNQLFGITL